MGNRVGKMQQSAPPTLPGDTAVEQHRASDSGATTRSTPVARNSPVPTGLRELPRGHNTPPADVKPQTVFLRDLPPNIMPDVASKLDLDAAKALRLTNKEFTAAGTSRFTGLAVPAAVEISGTARFFSGLVDRAFRAAGVSRFTDADVPAAEIGNMAQFFRDGTNICTLRITDKNNFSDQDLARSIEMLPGSGAKIRRLDLSGCHRLTDAALVKLTGMTAMQSLDLDFCVKITDAGLGHIKGLTAMQTLNLSCQS